MNSGDESGRDWFVAPSVSSVVHRNCGFVRAMVEIRSVQKTTNVKV